MQNSHTETKVNIEAIIESAENIAVVPAPKRGDDALFAAIGLHTMLLNKGKASYLLYNGELPADCTNIVDDLTVRPLEATKDLLVSIDYKDIDDAQVYFNTEDHTLHLRISPVLHTYKPEEKIKYELSGSTYDLVIFIGVSDLTELELPVDALESFLNGVGLINLDNKAENQLYGTLNYVEPTDSGLALLVLRRSLEWGLDLNENAAKSLLHGLSR